MSRVLIVPAAGRGTRLGATMPKALIEVAGRPMLAHILERHAGVADRAIVVASPGGRRAIEEFLDGSGSAEVLVQEEPTGMLDAVLVPARRVAELEPAEVWITWCDQVAVGEATVRALARAFTRTPAPALVFPTWQSSPAYIHFERARSGRITAVRQRREGDAMPAVGEGDIGLFALRRDAYLEQLPRFARQVRPGAGTGERNFLPFIPWLARRERVETLTAGGPMETIGINTPDELELVAAHLLAHR